MTEEKAETWARLALDTVYEGAAHLKEVIDENAQMDKTIDGERGRATRHL